MNRLFHRNLIRRSIFTKSIVEQGKGRLLPKAGDRIWLNWSGTIRDTGESFGSSTVDGYPMQIQLGLGRAVQGLEQACMTMRVGEKAIVDISPQYAFGEQGHKNIPPNAAIRYEVEVIQLRNDAPLYYWKHANIQSPKGNVQTPYALNPQKKITEDQKQQQAMDKKIKRLNAFLMRQRKEEKSAEKAIIEKKASKTKK